jgi:hypothetical protein
MFSKKQYHSPYHMEYDMFAKSEKYLWCHQLCIRDLTRFKKCVDDLTSFISYAFDLICVIYMWLDVIYNMRMWFIFLILIFDFVRDIHLIWPWQIYKYCWTVFFGTWFDFFIYEYVIWSIYLMSSWPRLQNTCHLT